VLNLRELSGEGSALGRTREELVPALADAVGRIEPVEVEAARAYVVKCLNKLSNMADV